MHLSVSVKDKRKKAAEPFRMAFTMRSMKKLSEWRILMRRICFRKGKKLGVLFLTLGSLIILALIMPPAFWCFALGAGLICAGIAIIRN